MRTDDFRPSDNVEDNREASASRGGIAGRSRRPRYRNGDHHRADQLVFRHRSQRAAQRRANSHWRRIDHAANQPGAAGHRRHTDRRDRQIRRLGAWRYRGSLDAKFSRRPAKPIIRRSCACSRAPNQRLARWRSRPWDRSIARAISASISIPRSSTICRTKFGGCSNSNACKFSEAYVIAHEVGHHVQDELGILPRVMQAQQASASKAERNALQVRVELQADCLAGRVGEPGAAEAQFP